MDEDSTELREKFNNGERIATVIEDSSEQEVIWEQRVKDVEAEKRRKSVTSPGFSFSAAGLLFPYHLGVAQFLIENGFIKVCCCFFLLFLSCLTHYFVLIGSVLNIHLYVYILLDTVDGVLSSAFEKLLISFYGR